MFTAADQLLEEPVRLPPVGNPRKRPVLPRQAHLRVLEHEHQKARLPRRETECLKGSDATDFRHRGRRNVFTVAGREVPGDS